MFSFPYFVIVKAFNNLMLCDSMYYIITKLLNLNFIDFVIGKLFVILNGQVLVLVNCFVKLACDM